MPNIKLTQDHTHAGVAYSAGHTLDVDQITADWLMTQGVANPLPDNQPAKTTQRADQAPRPKEI